MNRLKEQFLLFRVRTVKDAKAYGELYKAYAPSVRRFLMIKLPSEADTDDALSVTFLRGWNYMTDSEVEHVGGLLFTIARGVVADFYRKRPDAMVSIDQSSLDEVLAEKGSDSKVINEAEIALVKRALIQLTDEQREAIVLRYFEGESVRMIAKQLNKTENATRVLLHRALKSLKKNLER